MTWILTIILVSSIFIVANSKSYNNRISDLLEDQFNYREKVEVEYYAAISDLSDKIEKLEKENEKLRCR
jgi:hypothetical protein